MLYFVALLTLLVSIALPSTVNAAASLSPIVECSSIRAPPNATFDACATTYLESPSPASIEGETILVGGYLYQYTIVTGLKEGTDTSTMWQVDLNKALRTGIVVDVSLDDNDKCKVSVTIKNKSTACKSCTSCGNEKFTADCTNVPNGRSTKCESTASGRVYFPLTATALQTPSPVQIVKTPVRPSPKAPVRVPRKAPVPTPKAVPVKRPVAPVKTPTRVRAGN